MCFIKILWNLAMPKPLCKPEQTYGPLTAPNMTCTRLILTRAVIQDLANNSKDIRSMNMDIQKSQPQDSQKKNRFVLETNFYWFFSYFHDILWLNLASRPVPAKCSGWWSATFRIWSRIRQRLFKDLGTLNVRDSPTGRGGIPSCERFNSSVNHWGHDWEKRGWNQGWAKWFWNEISQFIKSYQILGFHELARTYHVFRIGAKPEQTSQVSSMNPQPSNRFKYLRIFNMSSWKDQDSPKSNEATRLFGGMSVAWMTKSRENPRLRASSCSPKTVSRADAWNHK